MINEPKRINFDEFAKQLRAVFDDVRRAGEPILVEREGQVYRLEWEGPGDIWAAYDPKRMRAALAQSAGALAGINREELLNDLREQRAQDGGKRPD